MGLIGMTLNWAMLFFVAFLALLPSTREIAWGDLAALALKARH